MRTHPPRFPPLPLWYRRDVDALKAKLDAGEITPAEYDAELEYLVSELRQRERDPYQ